MCAGFAAFFKNADADLAPLFFGQLLESYGRRQPGRPAPTMTTSYSMASRGPYCSRKLGFWLGFMVGGDQVFCGSMVTEILEVFTRLRPQAQRPERKIM